ncbi:sigma-54 dependent transcriptional regulator [Desulfuromonas carbonis]
MRGTDYPALPVLMVDDEEAWLRSMALMLARNGGITNVLKCNDSRQVMEILARQAVSLVLLDLTMPHLSGKDLLKEIGESYPEVPVIILTGRDRVETAVCCIKLGAFDYFVKTAEDDRLLAGVQRALRMFELERENRKLTVSFQKEQLDYPEAFSAIVTASDKLHGLFQYVEAVARSVQPVLITGESGVGKELIARAIHQISRPDGPWVAVNVAGLDDDVFSDTLFGHVRGAFTGAEQARKGLVEEADGGTLFLDEIGALEPKAQLKLLRLLQDGEYFPVGSDRPRRVNTRILAASNQDLEALQAAGSFRRDLFYRIRTHYVHIPPLRQRPEDIPLLLDHFLDEAAREFGKRKPTPPAELAKLLATYHFPGNVRELRAMVFDAVGLHQSRKLSMEPFKRLMGRADAGDAAAGHFPESEEDDGLEPAVIFGTRLPTLKEVVDQLIEEAGRRADGNQTIMAGMLGISRPALNKRLKKQTD